MHDPSGISEASVNICGSFIYLFFLVILSARLSAELKEQLKQKQNLQAERRGVLQERAVKVELHRTAKMSTSKSRMCGLGSKHVSFQDEGKSE